MLTLLLAAVALAPQAGPGKLTGPQLVVTLDSGSKFTIHCDQQGSPKTVRRVVELVRSKFYDGQRFHRVESWVVQWGSPESKKNVDAPGVPNGGSGKKMEFEGSKRPFVRGTVGVASTGQRVGGDSQLFVVTRDAEWLNGDYAVLGVVTVGMDVVAKVRRGDRIKSIAVLR